MGNSLFMLLQNKIFISLFSAWTISQISKLIIEFIKFKKIDPYIFFRSGGMLSAHSASVTALCAGVYLAEGVNNLFIVSLAFAILVMYDARGIRYEASKHAKLLNKLIKDGKIDFPKLKELIGHEVSEVIAGAILGIVVSIIVFWI